MPATTGILPGPGDTVRLDASASAEYVREPFYLLLTDLPEASSLDLAEGRRAETARWVLLTGWQLDDRGRQVMVRTGMPARREALSVVLKPNRNAGPTTWTPRTSSTARSAGIP